MKANSDKCHLITSQQSCVSLKIENINIENSTCEKLPDVKAGNKLNFNEHLDGIIKKASCNFSALSRIFPLMNLTRRPFLMNTFFISQFIYCPLICMRHVNNKISKLHKRCLRIVYNDNKSAFKELSETDKFVPIYLQNLQVLATEMFKVYRNISPLSWDNYFNQGIIITIYGSFCNLNYQMEEVFFVKVELFHFLTQKSGILFPKNLRTKYYMFSRNKLKKLIKKI